MGMFDLIKMLEDAEVDYVLVGGLAVAPARLSARDHGRGCHAGAE
jgi:hypothetical protein